MGASAIAIPAVHLALLGDLDDAGSEQLCAVLAYDGAGRGQLRPLAPTTTSAVRRATRQYPDGPCQLRLPLDDVLAASTSSGRTWRTWVLPSIPTSLRTLPPDGLAGALVRQLAGEVGR